MSEETKKILFQLEIVARKHTIKVTDTGNIETMPASVVNELRLNNFSAKILLDYITNLQNQLQQKENIIKEVREYIEHYETIRGYYEYEEDGYDEYNYEEDLKQELLEILDKVEE